MERVLSTLDHLERDIADFLNRKTKFNNFKHRGEKTDENFNIKANGNWYKSLNDLNVTGRDEKAQVNQRCSLGENSNRRHEIRNSLRNKRQGMLFPRNLDVTKIGDGMDVDERNVEIMATRLGEKTSPLILNKHQNRVRKGSLTENGFYNQRSSEKVFSNIILEMQARSEFEEVANQEKYELRVRMINDNYDCYANGDSESRSERIIKDVRLPVPEGLTSLEEDSLLHVFRQLCQRNGNGISEDFADIEQSNNHQVINEYFV